MTERARLDPALGEHFAVADAMAAGVRPSRLRASDLELRFWGARSVRLPGHVPELLAQCHAYAPVAPPRFWFSHVTAARLHGMPLPHHLEARTALDVSVPSAAQAPRRRGVIGHRLALEGVQWLHGLPVVTAELAWLQLSAVLGLDDLVVAGDAIVRRKRPVSTVERLTETVDAATGRRGAARARRALALVRAGTDSPRETRTRLALVRGGLSEPVIGFRVHHDGYFIGTPDLAYPAHRIAIEYQGRHHWEDPNVYEDDIVRRELFRRADWHTHLVTARVLQNEGRLAREIGVLLAERSAR